MKGTDTALPQLPFGLRVAAPPAASRQLAELLEHWRFVADNGSAPAERIAALLDHAARTRPGESLPIGELAMIVFGLPRPPARKSPYVAAVRAEYRRADVLLATKRRILLRLRDRVRASVDADDASAVLGPRYRRRAQAAACRLLRLIRARESDFLRESSVVAAMGDLDAGLLSQEDRAYRQAFLAAAGNALTTTMH
jgi:hypothetical protein